MLAFAALWILSQTSPKVSIGTGGSRIEAVLRDLSTQSGVTLKANSRVRGEIVVIYADQVPLKDLMAKIAQAEGAEWRPDGAGFELTRTREEENAQLATENAYRLASLKEDFEKKVGPQIRPLAANAKDVDVRGRMAWRACQGIGPEALAKMPGGVRVVWAENPTPMQRLLPFSGKALVKEFIDEATKTGDPSVNSVPTDAVHVEVAISRTLLNGYSIRVYLRGEKGDSLLTGNAELAPTGPNEASPISSGSPSTPDEKPLELSPNAAALRKIVREAQGGQAPERSSGFNDTILHPEKFDPLALFASDVARAYAKRQSRALVAVIPDFAVLMGLFTDSDFIYPQGAKNWMEKMCVVDTSVSGWMVLTPKYAFETRTLRADRVKMGEFYRSARGDGVRLIDLANYISTQPRRYYETISFFYGFFCAPEVVRMCDPDAVGALRIYAALSPAQRSMFERGAEISVALMPANAKAEAADWVYNAGVMSYGGDQEMEFEPTTVFPNGLTLPCSISATVRSQPEVVPLYNGKEDLDGTPLDGASLGLELHRFDKGEAKIKEPMTAFWFGTRADVNMELRSPHYELKASLHEHRISRKGQPISFAQLPDAFRKQAEAARRSGAREEEAAPMAAPGSAGGGKTQP